MRDDFLKGIPFFSHLPTEQLDALAAIGTVQEAAPGRRVVAEGDTGHSLYVILEGRVKVHVQDDAGNENELSTLEAGDFFGELSLLDGKPRSASVTSLAPCRFFVLDRDEFIDLVAHSPVMLSQLLIGLSSRIRDTNDRFLWEVVKESRLRAQMESDRHRSLAEMVAGVAHELNTPLGIATAAASVIDENLDALPPPRDEAAKAAREDMRQAAQLIQTHVARADKLIQSFKNLSVRQILDIREVIDLAAFLEEAVGLYKLQSRRPGLDITFRPDLPAGGRTWDGYPGYLTQVLMNLLSNIERYAYPAGHPGKVEIAVTAASDDGFVLRVQDFGRGMTPEALSRIYDPFFTTGRDRGGTGLGLAIVHNLVTSALQGHIEVTSAVGEGTTFTVYLPRVVPPKNEE